MARYVTTEILGSQCIGDSRTVINTNFENLDTKIQTLSTNTLTLSTTSTVQFTEPFNSVTRRIAAFVRPASIDSTHLASDAVTTTNLSARAVTTDKIAPEAVRYSQLASWQALSASPTLSAEAVQPRVAKAWINFVADYFPSYGGFGLTDGQIYSSYNVVGITVHGTGQYTINFRPGTFTDPNYVYGQSCAASPGQSQIVGIYTPNIITNLVQNKTVSACRVIVTNSSTYSVNSNVGLVFFGN
jgi:hypothetical protein